MAQSDLLVYCFNPGCQLHSQPLSKTTCQQCGGDLTQHGYVAIARLGHNQFSRTLLALQNGKQCVIHQRWDGSHAAVELPLRSLSCFAQIPTFLDYFEQDGVSHLVQDFIQGENLAQRELTQPQIWRLLEHLLPVLQQIHAHDLIHGDIKPENIIQTEADQFVLVDFGSANLSHRFNGSPIYAAPEQIQGKTTFVSDLYSLGVVCIHLLTGIAPFQLFNATANQWVWRDYWLPTAPTPEVNALTQVLDRLIAPNLEDRFSSATDAIAQIEQLRSRKIAPLQTLPTWSNTATLIGHEGLFASVTAVVIAPNGTQIASASEDKTIRVWDRATGEVQVILQGHTQFVQAIAVHPHHAQWLLSAGRDRQIKLWDWTAQQEVFSIPAHDQAINALAFSPDGQQFISGSADKTIRLWSIKGEQIAQFAEHRLAINAVAFAPSASLIASASSDATVRIWQTDPTKRARLLSGHLQAVRAIAFSPNGQILASGGEDKTIRLWEVASGHCIRILPGHSWSVSALVFASNQILISGSWDKTIKIWQVETGQVIEQLVGHTDSITSVAMHPPEHFLVSGSRDRTVKLWQIKL